MKPVIKLTIHDGRACLINTALFQCAYQVGDGTTRIEAEKSSFRVKETPEEILALMEVEA